MYPAGRTKTCMLFFSINPRNSSDFRLACASTMRRAGTPGGRVESNSGNRLFRFIKDIDKEMLSGLMDG